MLLDPNSEPSWQTFDILLKENSELVTIPICVSDDAALKLIVYGRPEHIKRQRNRRNPELSGFECEELMNVSGEAIGYFLQEPVLRGVEHVEQRHRFGRVQFLGTDGHARKKF